jgi:hypothetical protein
MFALFNTPQWQHKNPRKRLQAIAGLNQEQLCELACNDVDRDVRHSAITHISSVNTLEQVLQTSSYKDDANFIAQNWATRLLYHEQISAFEAEQCLLQCKNSQLLFAFVSLCDDDNAKIFACAGIDDEKYLLQILKSQRKSQLSFDIIDRLQQRSSLQQALDYCRNHKKLQRKIKDKLKALTPQ